MNKISGQVADILEIRDHGGAVDDDLRASALDTLECGGIVYLRNSGFELSGHERELVANASVTLPTRKERKSRNGRPTVIFEPDRGRIMHARMKSPQREELEAILSRYASWATETIRQLFPRYEQGLLRDRTTYRPCERATTQGLHVDASYGRPTGGHGMLRIFCNINPDDQPRVWRVGESFEPFAQRFVPHARLKPTGLSERLLGRLGITKGQRTPYDHLMEDIRGQVKRDSHYQQESPQTVFEFPAGAAWIAITDLVLHGAVSGQHSLDQTFFLPSGIMAHPNRSSLRILERLTQTCLTH